MCEVQVSAVANNARTTYRISTAVDDQWNNLFFSWDGTPVADWGWAHHASAAAHWVAARTSYELDLLQEGDMCFCTDTGQAWVRTGGALVQITSSG